MTVPIHRVRRVVFAGALAAGLIVGSAGVGAPASAAGAGTGEVRVPAGKSVPNSYLVVLADSARAASAAGVHQTARDLTNRVGGTVSYEYTAALHGFAVRTSAGGARALAADPRVAYVEQDIEMHALETQNNATWGLDRIDQRDLPLSTTYTFNTRAANVHAYIIDTGIFTAHPDFGGRASVAFDSVGDGRNGTDCHGHGTHVAGTVGGTTWGVAKNVRLHAVRVLSCLGSGTTAGVIAGVDWVTSNHIKPAVANMSLGGGVQTSLDAAVRNSIAAGVTYAIAAGNSNADACTASPARTAEAITVGATANNDARASFSNFGTCLDIFAPGVGITSAWLNGGTNTISGTSMASPHVAGAAALYLADHPQATPLAVRNALVNGATPGKVSNPGPGSPNALLYTLFDGGTPPPPPSNRYEAEDATISQGAAESNHAGFSGTGFVNYNNVAGSYVQWAVTPKAAGSATLTFRYANGSTANRPMDIAVNGVLVADELAFPPTGSWTTWQTVTITVNLAAGTNTVRATATTANGGPNVDYVEVGEAGPPPPVTRYEAENATISQGVVESNHAGFSGTGFVNYNNVAGSYVQWSVNAPSGGTAKLAFRYANGSTANRPMDIAVNGAPGVGGLPFPPTGAWTTWQTVTITVNLAAGTNVIRATATTANGGPNVDYLEVQL
jgi:subtilisin family serine protease